MGNLRRIENLIPVLVFSLAFINPHPSVAFGLKAVLVVYLMILLVFFGIFWGLAFSEDIKMEPIMSSLVLIFVGYYITSLLSSVAFEKPIRLDEHYFIPLLYLAFFLGTFSDGKTLPKLLPWILIISSAAIFFEVIISVFYEYRPTLRFGYRNVFFCPAIIAYTLFLMSREKSLWMKSLYLLSVFLSFASIIFFGNRTNYISLPLLILIIVFYSLFRGGFLRQIYTIINVFLVSLITGLGIGYIMLGNAFLVYMFSRFLSLFEFAVERSDPSAQIRIYDYSLAMERFSQSPVFGATSFDVLVRWIEGKIVMFVDSSFITVLWKLGIFGFAVYVLILSYALYIILQGVSKKDDFALFSLLLFVSLLITATTTTALIHYIHIAPLMISVGILSRSIQTNP